MLTIMAIAAGAVLGATIAHLTRIARPRPMSRVPGRAMRQLLERLNDPSTPDGTG